MKIKKYPKYASENARKALECIKKGSKAMTETGIKRAEQLANEEPLTLEDLKKIDSFRRHQKNAEYQGDICKDRGAVAWLGWGNSLKKRKGVPDFSNWVRRKKEEFSFR